MELTTLYQRVIGLDVHQAQITACAIIQEADGTTRTEQRQFGAFKRDRRELAEWAASLKPDQVVMESTGIYWKSPCAALEMVGIHALVVNARHVKNVPGRKTDVGDAQWLATLARAGLLRGSFVPPAKLRELRLVTRQRQKPVGQLSAEKNRLHKLLTDSGIRLGVVVSDIHGQSARAMVKAIIAGQPPHDVLHLASWRLKDKARLRTAMNMYEASGKTIPADLLREGQRGILMTDELKKFLESAMPGLVNVRVHDLKHTFGRRLRAAGVPLETRKVLLGDKNGDITSHYSAPEIEELLDGVNRVCRSKSGKSPAITLLKRKIA